MGFGCGIGGLVGVSVPGMAYGATTKAARAAARTAALAAAEELAARTRANMADLAAFFSARERAESVDDWLAEKVAALQEQARARRDEQRRACGVALAAMVGPGFGISVCNVGINMLLQSIAPDRLRGRVVSFFTSARFGFDALGGLLAGVIAAALGAGPTLVGEGVVLVLFVLHLAGRARRLADQVAEHAASRP